MNISNFLFWIIIVVVAFTALVAFLGYKKRKRNRGVHPERAIRKEFEHLQNKIETASTRTELAPYDEAIDIFYHDHAGRNHPYVSDCYRRLITSFNKRGYELRGKMTAVLAILIITLIN